MYFYSMSFVIEVDSELLWVNFAKNNFIPPFMELGEFTDYRFTKVLTEDQPDPTYNIQFSVNNTQKLNLFLQSEGKRIHNEMVEKFNGKIAVFSLLLQDIR
jgi:hypothetical protein